MSITIREYREDDLDEILPIWNEVVTTGRAFPQVDTLSKETGAQFFAAQTRTAVAVDDKRILGLYILHPNDIGRKAHIANASYAVSKEARGLGIGRLLVLDSIEQLSPHGFTGLQFNAVVASNLGAIHLYESIGFTRIGTIPGGFRNIDGDLEDMHIFYHPAR